MKININIDYIVDLLSMPYKETSCQFYFTVMCYKFINRIHLRHSFFPIVGLDQRKFCFNQSSISILAAPLISLMDSQILQILKHKSMFDICIFKIEIKLLIVMVSFTYFSFHHSPLMGTISFQSYHYSLPLLVILKNHCISYFVSEEKSKPDCWHTNNILLNLPISL